MRLQDRNMIGGAGVSLQKNGASGILFQFVKDLIKYYKFKYIGSDGSSPKKSIPGRSRALNIDLEPSPSPGPSQKFDPEP